MPQKDLFENCIFLNIVRNLQSLILKYKTFRACIALDMVLSNLLMQAVFKHQLAQWYGFLRLSFPCQAFCEHIFVPAKFFGALYMYAK